MNRGKLANIFIGALIALLPIYTRICRFDLQRTSKDNLLAVVLCILSAFFVEKKRSLSVFLWVCLAYSLFMIVYNQHDVASINVMFQCFYISVAISFFISFYEKHDSSTTRYIIYGMIAGATFQSIFTIFQYFGYEAYYTFIKFITNQGGFVSSPGRGSANAIGSLGNNNLLSSYLAITGLSFLYIKRWWLIIIPVVGILLTGSHMGTFSLVFGILYYINAKKNIVNKAVIYLSTIIAMVVSFFTGLYGMDSGRLEIWGNNFKLVTWKHFLFGMGPGWMADTRVRFANDSFAAQEHNAFLSVFNVVGIIPFLLIAPVFYLFLMKKDKNIVFSSILFTAFFNSYGHFTLNQSTVALIIIVALAICLAEGN